MNDKLEYVIFRVLTERFSGGCKVTEFVVELVKMIQLRELSMDEMICITGTSLEKACDDVIEACEKSERLGVLVYTCHFDHQFRREKSFIYTK